MILEKIKKPNDIHRIPLADFPLLADEIRDFLIQSVSKTGGHLASNLGVVEMTLALHNVLNFPEDKLIWDVGHQAYTHKILTGRKEQFINLRQEGGLSGFPKRNESDCDSFDAGHSSNSISAGLGYVRARDILGQKHTGNKKLFDTALCLSHSIDHGFSYPGNLLQSLRHPKLHPCIGFCRSQSAEVSGHSTYISGNRHIIIINNNNKIGF